MSNKLIAKNSFFLYIRLIATTIIGLLYSRFTLGALGAENYGLYSVVGGIVYAMAFINNVMITTTYRYIAVEIGKKDGNVNKTFNISLLIHGAISALVLLLAFTVGIFYLFNYLNVPAGRLNDAVVVFSLSTFSIVFTIIGTPFQGLLVAKEKFSVTVPIEVSSKGFALLMVIILGFVPGNRLVLFSIFVTMAQLINPIMYMLYSFKKYYEEIKPRFYFDRKRYLEMLRFSGWMGIGATANMVEQQGSALIINRFFGTILNASFGIANQVKSLVMMFASSLGQAVVPQIAKSYSAGDHKRSLQLVAFASKYSFMLMLIPLVPIMLEINFMLNLWLPEVPEYTTNFVRIMLIQSLIGSISSGIPSLIQASGKVAYFTIVTSVTLVLTLPIAYVLFTAGYPPYCISYIFATIALLTLISTITLLRLILHYNIMFFLKEVILKDILILFVVAPAITIPLTMNEGWHRMFVSAFTGETLLIIAIYFIGMDAKEKYMLRNLIHTGYSRLRLMLSRENIPKVV